MIVSVNRAAPRVILDLSEREAQVIEQALFLASNGKGNAFQNDVNSLDAELIQALDEASIATLAYNVR